MKIAIIDIIGLPYDGTTVYRQGLGGSESAVTYVSAELAALGFTVTVFNNCDIDHARAGIYSGVTFRPLTDLAHDHTFDIVISSRTIIPFMQPERYLELQDHRAMPLQGYNLYNRIVSKAKMRILWMHDTFCLGDNYIEELAVGNRITDIFTLSDFHLTYVANCHHGRRRNFEVLKPRLFITRNGAKKFDVPVDIAAKDRNLFVYNASVTKGMIPLVNEVWPRVRQAIPTAQLKVIGGYYRFSEAHGPDQQEQDWRRMVADPRYSELGIEFTGVIPQSEIAKILAQAYMMIYPGAFPETFGISSLESLIYNTPVATCRFGALEEIVPELAGYHLDYAIEPNSLFTDIDRARQCELFADMVIRAWNNPYLHQQKQYYCNSVKDLAGWDSVALQWKQFFYRRCGQYLSRDEYRRVTAINKQVHRVWQRRYTNVTEFDTVKSGTEQKISVVSTFYNAEPYIAKFIHSVATQDYDNYSVYMVNDASTDQTLSEINRTLELLPQNIASKFHVIDNKENLGAVCNQVMVFRALQDTDSIVMIIDGDDSLVNDNGIFSYYNSIYNGSTEFTYGSCWSVVDNIPLISQPYPDAVKQQRAYRQHKFNWILPYTHLRTFKSSLITDIPDSAFQDSTGRWYRAGGDGSTFYNLIEAADPDRVKCLSTVVYNYNDASPLNDYKVNGAEQNRTAQEIITRREQTVEKPQAPMIKNKRILIAIPTAKNIEVETFKSIYDLQVPEGYETDFQYFYGYNIDQIRNLIADWVVRGYDYLFSVDSDIAFAPDTLVRMLSYNVDMVSGLYIQRKPGEHILEVYEHNNQGGVSNIPYEKIKGRGLVEIASCGFGCVLVKAEVMRAIPYPHFKYHSALDHRNTISEDVDFCRKAIAAGFRIYADTDIHCRHIGQNVFSVNNNLPAVPEIANEKPLNLGERRLIEISRENHLDPKHVNYLRTLAIKPRVIYDIGANALEWSRTADKIWPDSEIIAFEAMTTAQPLYSQHKFKFHIGVLSDTDNKTVKFYQNDLYPWGNSYYMENEQLSPPGCEFNEGHAVTYQAQTLDSVVRDRGFPAPDFIKIDVQGAEMDVLRGATECLKTCENIIIEIQHKEYNKGAPNQNEMFEFMASLGFELVQNIFLKDCDGDYHFKKKVNTVSRVYILRTQDPRSIAYSETAADSCNKLQLAWEYFSGFEKLSQDQLWPQLAMNITVRHTMSDAAACATASHIAIWKKIVENKETAVILEHDALLLQPITLPIPDDTIVALGYKFSNANNYDYHSAGAPTKIIPIRRHSGAHAYAITWRTAQRLLEEIERRGILNAIDNFYFMRINDPGDTETEVPLTLMMPTPAICWLRESTIWPTGPSTLNYDLQPEFLEYLQ